jgi:hypothetical protein
MCESVGYSPTTWVGTSQTRQTGTTSSIPTSSLSEYPWPPVTVSHAVVPVSLMPTYTTTAAVITMPFLTFASIPSSATQSFDGWFDKADTSGGITTVAGCSHSSLYRTSRGSSYTDLYGGGYSDSDIIGMLNIRHGGEYNLDDTHDQLKIRTY